MTDTQQSEHDMKEAMTILLAKEGNESAFRHLYEDHRERIYRMSYRYTRSKEDAEDIMQETFVKAFKGIAKFRNNHSGSFSAWINTICAHCSINHIRKKERRKTDQTISFADLDQQPDSEQASPEILAQWRQTFQLLQKAIHKLSPQQRIIFDLRHEGHKEIKEIARVLNCSESNVKTQLFRSVAKLRKQLLWVLEET